MEDVITTEWQLLYANNPAIQYFGVCKGTEVIWQTNNWNLVKDVENIVSASKTAASTLSVNKITYHRISSSEDEYIGTAEKKKGHIILYRIESNSWVIARVENTSVAELAKIDVARTAINLIGLI